MAPYSIVPTVLHEFQDSKGHQRTICMFEAIKRCYWWPILWLDIVNYIDKCSVCVQHLPNMARYPPKHLEILQITLAVLAIDTIGHFPIMSKGNRLALTAICLHTSYMSMIPMKEKPAENVIHACLSCILAHKGRSLAILSNNGMEFKNKILNEPWDQLGIKQLFSNPLHPQGNAEDKNVHVCIKFLILLLNEFGRFSLKQN